ncbi:MAG TPA: L-threonylcarbamoyladenylate synthase, partial [Limnochordia bacterium]|nr:L-threonylcarbamoyladenylate synthase [Limnochordia bacterium]
LDAAAVRRIFAAKGRPADNPLIVHIASREQLDRLAAAVSPASERLIARFWPGPLSLLFARRPEVPDATTGGLDTVAVRMPAHPAALALIEAAGVPIAAPSANRSGRPSPTRAEHVLADFGDEVRFVLDAGPCRVGVESTVVDARLGAAEILRPGGVTAEALAELGFAPLSRSGGERPRAPGMKYRHYAPEAPVHLLPGDPSAQLERMQALDDGAVVIASEELLAACGGEGPRRLSYGRRDHPELIAAALYDLLRRADQVAPDAIWIEPVAERGIGLAVMDRLRKAAAGGPPPR